MVSSAASETVVRSNNNSNDGSSTVDRMGDWSEWAMVRGDFVRWKELCEEDISEGPSARGSVCFCWPAKSLQIFVS